ncbi:MAG: hypothetical protein BMS9Abin06_0030 [Gammaproteobacteria bacterium]|nr:MAG: hypothetical protein BMS9Abin06_0030 [Gammaproteobacteria bacterium]
MDIKREPGDMVHRLAWLPIVFLTEQENMFERYGRDEDIEDAYRDVITTSLWVYLLYTYHGMVRRHFDSATETRVREIQLDIFNDEQPGSGDSILAALELVECALSAGVERDPDWSIQFKMPTELAVALALLLGLPDSPDYRARKPKTADYAVHRMPGVDWRLARALARGRQELIKTFSPIIDKFDLVPETKPTLIAY